jgi:hypothetical protein
LLHLGGFLSANVLDPSALGSLTLSYEASHNTRLVCGTYLATGRRPRAGTLPQPRSEFGAYPDFVFTELRVAL